MFTIRATYIPRDDMYFDKEYYVSHHIPLAKQLLKDQVNYINMYAEFDSCVMMNETEVCSPGIFVLTVESKSDVDDFNAFRRSDDVIPLREDIKNYTNCTPEWTVDELIS